MHSESLGRFNQYKWGGMASKTFLNGRDTKLSYVLASEARVIFKGVTIGFIWDPPTYTYIYIDIGVDIRFIPLNVRL